ncbi:hypothetical protein LOK49_LG07G02104 [Camellia lanceoleosa]|uniref:Uncharacterized protein n=1 Tax=Camellia lanceoleosa TaxID=1840588 RepID=A0ACC0H9Z4_9ERIC|nr:hypothetical protein LOK49_LG07G02104 [Camellia lanceoleosa]
MRMVGEVLSAVHLFDKMTENGVKGNVYTYGILINGLCKIHETSRRAEQAIPAFGMLILDLPNLDKYLHSNDNHIIAGALLGVGIVNWGMVSRMTVIPHWVLLLIRIDKEDSSVRIKKCNNGSGPCLCWCLKNEQESVEVTAEVSKTFNEKIRKYCDMTLLSCAYAGTGNVLKVQHLLGQCAQHLEKWRNPSGTSQCYGYIARQSHLYRYRSSKWLPAISLGLIGAGTNNARIAGMFLQAIFRVTTTKKLAFFFCVPNCPGSCTFGKRLVDSCSISF